MLIVLASQLSFIYTLYSYSGIRHPTSEETSHKHSPYFPSDSEDISPLSTSSPHYFSKSTFRSMRSEDYNRTLNQSNVTLPKYNSISTLTPSTSCTGRSRSHSSPPPRDASLPRISPPTSRGPSIHAISYGSLPTQVGFETASQTQSINAVTAASWSPQMLRRTSRISLTQVAPDTMLSDITSHSPTTTRDPPETRSCASWKPGHRGSGVHLDVGKTTLTWENAPVRHASQAGTGPESFSSTHDNGESVEEKVKGDDVLVYSYGYGASEPTYPYLDMYNPQRPDGYTENSSLCEEMDEHGLSRGHWRAIPSGPALHDVSSEPRSSTCREDEEESSGEEEEYVAMMGGFVRRMATIESLGSKEAAGTLSTTTGSVALHSMRSGAPTSQFSSVRFADLGSSYTPSLGMLSSRQDSHSTAYLSFSSGGTGMRVNERGELLSGLNANRGAAGSLCDGDFYTASGSSFTGTGDDDG